MSARIVLHFIQGEFAGQRREFDRNTRYVVGRAQDCDLRLPDDGEHRIVGRHHCELVIDPPRLWLRDLNSVNGVYVNGRRIPFGENSETRSDGNSTLQELADGDRIEIGGAVIRVSILLGACASCGKDASAEWIGPREGSFICSVCQSDPSRIVDRILSRANAGQPDLISVQGYEILELLGRGGMGVVYLARHLSTGALAALKLMLPEVAASQEAVDRFLREMEITKALRHPNVVEVRDFGFSHGAFFFALEYCEGLSADKFFASEGRRLDVDKASDIILQALEGLAYVHEVELPYVRLTDGTIGRGHGLVHRDVTPHNILLAGKEDARIAKLGDYGMAKAFGVPELSPTVSGVPGGKPGFVPRQVVTKGYKYVGPEVDVWAMAACYYYLLTGRYPRDFHPEREPWNVIRESSAVPLLHRDPAIPRRLAEVLDAALIDRPEIHFKTARAFKRAIEEALWR